LLDASIKFGLTYDDAATNDALERIKTVLNNLSEDRDYNEEIAKDISTVWNHPTTQELLSRKHELQFLDSAPYFLNKAAQVASADWLPTDEDVLRARVMTTGIVKFDFEVPHQNTKFKFELIDVGGQRTERRKWIHVFEDVTAVLFIISLSDYNQTLYEDENTNRMHESERLFGEILNNLWFRNTAFIVFFNKVDLFKEKLKTHPLTIAYKDYKGSQNFEEALKFVKKKFLSLDGKDKDGNRNKILHDIKHFETTATDTNLVQNVLNTVQNIILEMILKQVIG